MVEGLQEVLDTSIRGMDKAMTLSENGIEADRCAANRKKPIRLKLGSLDSQLAHSGHLRYFNTPREQPSKVAPNLQECIHCNRR